MLCNFKSHFLIAEILHNYNSYHSSGIRSLKNAQDFPKYGKAFNIKGVCGRTYFKDDEEATLFISRTSQQLYLICNIIPMKT